MEHSLQNDHAERLVPARDDEDVGGAIPAAKLIGCEPASEVHASAVGLELGGQPPARHLLRSAVAVAAGEHEARVRRVGEDVRDGREQLADSFSIDEAAAEQHNRRLARPLRSLRGFVGDAVANDSDASGAVWAVLLDQAAFAVREITQSAPAIDSAWRSHWVTHSGGP